MAASCRRPALLQPPLLLHTCRVYKSSELNTARESGACTASSQAGAQVCAKDTRKDTQSSGQLLASLGRTSPPSTAHLVQTNAFSASGSIGGSRELLAHFPQPLRSARSTGREKMGLSAGRFEPPMSHISLPSEVYEINIYTLHPSGGVGGQCMCGAFTRKADSVSCEVQDTGIS